MYSFVVDSKGHLFDLIGAVDMTRTCTSTVPLRMWWTSVSFKIAQSCGRLDWGGLRHRYLNQHSAFADVVDYSKFTAVVNPKLLNQSNIVDILEVCPPSISSSLLYLEEASITCPGVDSWIHLKLKQSLQYCRHPGGGFL